LAFLRPLDQAGEHLSEPFEVSLESLMPDRLKQSLTSGELK